MRRHAAPGPAVARRAPLAAGLVAACALAGCSGRAAATAAAVDAPVAIALDRLPPRPSLGPAADTNEAGAYQLLGIAKLRTRPDSASAALFWATRLNPAWAEALHARAMAVRLARGRPVDAGPFPGWRPERPGPRQAAVADSLERLAFGRDPFVRGLTEFLMPVALFFVRLPQDDAEAGFLALQQGRFDSAATRLARAQARRPNDPSLRMARAYALYHLQRYDTAAVELRGVLGVVDSLERTRVGSAALTRAAVYHALGAVQVRRADTLAAREAFEAALAADLTFPMARVRRAGLALAAGDTAGALADLQQEVEVRGDDPVARLHLAQLLGAMGKHQEAAGQLFLAMNLAPEYATLYVEMARLYDAARDPRGALEWYEQFLVRAARSDPLREEVAARVERIRAALPPDAGRDTTGRGHDE